MRALPLLLVFVSLSTARGQVGPLPSWRVLAEESAAVVVGEVQQAQLWVISPDKEAKARVTPKGKPTFPNPDSFVLGILSRVRVKEILKTDGRSKRDDIVSVFIPGYIGLDMPDMLMKNEKYVLFLRPLEVDNKDFVDATVVPPGTLGSPDKHIGFSPDDIYAVLRDGYAQVKLRPDRMKIIDEIKQAIVKHH